MSEYNESDIGRVNQVDFHQCLVVYGAVKQGRRVESLAGSPWQVGDLMVWQSAQGKTQVHRPVQMGLRLVKLKWLQPTK